MADAENDCAKNTKDSFCKDTKEKDEAADGSQSTSNKSQNEVRLEVKSLKNSLKNHPTSVLQKFVYIASYSKEDFSINLHRY